MGSTPIRVVVAGGSVGGLCAGIALRGVGCEVEVHERTRGTMSSSGAGIVVQDDLWALLRRHGAPDLPVTSCQQRRYLLFDTGNGITTEVRHWFTSWSALYRTLRSTFPNQSYHLGSTLTEFRQTGGRVTACFAGRGEVETDLLICADGSRSETRRRLLPDVNPRYAGYVAWRGTLEEEDVSPALVRFFDNSLTFCEARSGGHILCYFIPGPEAATEFGRRRLNWVWYVNVPAGPKLNELLTDRAGKLREGSVPAGMVPPGLVNELHKVARGDLHPRFAELVQSTPNPFIQTIFDVIVPRMVFGRICLIGDAAFVLRPHAAAATAKAAKDATALAAALIDQPTDTDPALQVWQAEQLKHGRDLVHHCVALGGRSVETQESSTTLNDAAERFGGIGQPHRRA